MPPQSAFSVNLDNLEIKMKTTVALLNISSPSNTFIETTVPEESQNHFNPPPFQAFYIQTSFFLSHSKLQIIEIYLTNNYAIYEKEYAPVQRNSEKNQDLRVISLNLWSYIV